MFFETFKEIFRGVVITAKLEMIVQWVSIPNLSKKYLRSKYLVRNEIEIIFNFRNYY
jgi:hypothetical protein